jgi:hypothetical protein
MSNSYLGMRQYVCPIDPSLGYGLIQRLRKKQQPQFAIFIAGRTSHEHRVDRGSSRTSDGRLDAKLSVPGTSGAGTNPGQLFAAA